MRSWFQSKRVARPTVGGGLGVSREGNGEPLSYVVGEKERGSTIIKTHGVWSIRKKSDNGNST